MEKLLLVALLGFSLLNHAHASHGQTVLPVQKLNSSGCYEYVCPAGHPVNLSGGPVTSQTACDPVFVTYDAVQKTARQTLKKGDEILSSVKLGDLLGEGERLTKALEQAKDASTSKRVALDAWEADVSVELQQHATIYARHLAKSTDEIQVFDFMLAALDYLDAQVEKCLELGKDNGLMKKKTMERLALIMKNPNLKEKMK